MQVKVNNFMLMHDGKLYKAGDIVDIADKDTAKRVVANSGGDFSFADETVVVEKAAENHPTEDDLKDNGGEEGGADSGGLPAADAAAAIQTGKTK